MVLNTLRFSGSVLNIGDFGEYNGIYNTRKVQYLLTIPHECIFLKKVSAC